MGKRGFGLMGKTRAYMTGLSSVSFLQRGVMWITGLIESGQLEYTSRYWGACTSTLQDVGFCAHELGVRCIHLGQETS